MTIRWLAILAFIVFPPAVAADDPVAVVAKYLPPKAELLIKRVSGADVVAGLGTPLYVGDTITVATGDKLEVAYADGDHEELAGPVTFTVPEKEEMGVTARIYGRLQTMLGRKYRQGSNLATRGSGDCDSATPPLEAPVLSSTTLLRQGHENIALAWIGGCAPYSLVVSGPGNAGVQLQNLKRPLTRIDARQFSAGNYSLTIRDARSQEFAVELVVVDAIPEGPVESANIDTELAAVAYAAWLASFQNGSWRLESFQQLRPWIRGGGVMAGTYGDLVMWGDPSLDLSAAD